MGQAKVGEQAEILEKAGDFSCWGILCFSLSLSLGQLPLFYLLVRIAVTNAVRVNGIPQSRGGKVAQESQGFFSVSEMDTPTPENYSVPA